MTSPRALLEYNSGRTARMVPAVVTDAVRAAAHLDPAAARVLAVLMGRWAQTGAAGCRPYRGVHATHCPHQSGTIAYRVGEVARDLYGDGAGGSQILLVRRALNVAMATRTLWLAWDGEQLVEREGHLILWRERRSDGSGRDAEDVITLDPFVHRSLLEGRFQALPWELVAGLGRSDFLVWAQLLLQPANSRNSVSSYRITGPNPAISPALCGLGGLRRGRLKAALDRAAAAGNKLQSEWFMTVDEGAPKGRRLHGELHVGIVRQSRDVAAVGPQNRGAT